MLNSISQIGIGFGVIATSALVASTGVDTTSVDILDYILLTLPSINAHVTVRAAITLITFSFGVAVSWDGYRRRRNNNLKKELALEDLKSKLKG